MRTFANSFYSLRLLRLGLIIFDRTKQYLIETKITITEDFKVVINHPKHW